MRQTFVLHKPIKKEKYDRKRFYVNGFLLGTQESVDYLLKKNINVQTKFIPTGIYSKIFHGIKIGSNCGGLVVWAKNKEETQKLLDFLIEERLFKSTCRNMPIERREDKTKYIWDEE